MQLSPEIISLVQKPRRRPRIPYAQNKDILALHMIGVIKKIKTAHNPISKYLQWTIKIKGKSGKLPFIKETERLKLHR